MPRAAPSAAARGKGGPWDTDVGHGRARPAERRGHPGGGAHTPRPRDKTHSRALEHDAKRRTDQRQDRRRRRKARAASSAPAGRGADLSGAGGFSASALGHLHDPRGPPSSAPPAGTWLASRDLSRLPRAVPSLVSNVSPRCSESPRSSFSAPQTSSRRTSQARQETATPSASSSPAVRRPGKRVTLPVSGPHCGCKK